MDNIVTCIKGRLRCDPMFSISLMPPTLGRSRNLATPTVIFCSTKFFTFPYTKSYEYEGENLNKNKNSQKRLCGTYITASFNDEYLMIQ